jgi:hypothetical protein
MTVREHLSAHHATAAAFHKAAAAEHSGLAESHHGLAKLDGAAHDGAIGEHHKTMAAHHEKLAKLHKGYADHHDQQSSACAKGMDATDLAKLQPTGVSGVVPTRITAVPRHGQPVAKVNVDPAFEHLFKVDEGEERSLA